MTPICDCPNNFVMVEYSLTDKYHYDGVSELECPNCKRRVGRWCKQELFENEVEPRWCDGKGGHPKVFVL